MTSSPVFQRLPWAALFIVLALASLAASAAATEVRIFRADKREAMAKGTLDALSLDPLGALELARRVERLATPEEPFVFTAAVHPDGWLLGTGNSGKVLLVGSDGTIEELFAADEPEVFAVLADDDGTVWAGTSPNGKVYRIRGDEEEPEVVFESGDAYVWALALDARGRLLVGTGLEGRLYRVDADGSAEVLFESPDSHVRAIAVRDDRILVGTAGQGLVLELRPDTGKKGDETVVRTLYDAVQPEVTAFAARLDGGVYVAVLASEASQVDLSRTQAPATQTDGEGENKDEGEGEGKVTVTQVKSTTGSRGTGFAGARSLVLEVHPDDRVEELESFQEETVHSLLWHDEELWIGTGQEGHLLRRVDDRLVLERDLEERQVVALVAGAAVTTNAAALYRIPDGVVDEGTYTSQVLDAGQVARFGTFRWQGELPAGSGVTLAARSGMSSTADATWTPWRTVGTGREASLDELATGRYVQWRATLTGKEGHGPRILTTELSYRQQNLRPEIKSFEVLAPGEILVPQNFNPQSTTFEPWSPNREGIFTSLRAETSSDKARLKTLWKKGYRSLRWEAADANEDDLVYTLALRREDAEEDWLTIVEELDETHYSFDAGVLPDGVYRFRLSVSDGPGQPAGEELVAEKLSEAVVVDHSPPSLVAASRDGGTLEVELSDQLHPLRDVTVSVDARAWEDAAALDGLLDARRETVRVAVPEGARMVLLRVTDAAWNTVTFDLLNGRP